MPQLVLESWGILIISHVALKALSERSSSEINKPQ